MGNNVVIKKSDYERYKIPISFINIFPKKKNNYLCEELEKRHPCFSDAFCYSSKDYITKHGIISDVVVMEKAKLAEYKNKCSLVGSLSLEEEKKINVFRNKKINLFFFIGIALICIFILILFNSQKNKNDTVVLSESTTIENKHVEKELNYNLFDKNILGILFDVIRNNDGKLNSLNWKVNYLGENVSSSIVNIYPEQLEAVFPELNIPTVTYSGKRPVINFNFFNNFLLNKECVQNEKISLNAKKLIRAFFEENKIKIYEESISPYGILFEGDLNKYSGENNFFLKLSELLSSIDLYVIEIVIAPFANENINQKCRINLTFSNNSAFENNILNIIGRNIDLFFYQNVKKPVSTVKKLETNLTEKINIEKKINLSSFEGLKVGEITYKNGRKIVFYKDNRGKIIKKEF